MKRREFFEKGGTGIAGICLASLGLSSCAKKEEEPATEAAQQAHEEPHVHEEMSQKDMVKHMLVESGKTEEEVDAMMAEMEEMLPMIKEKCICKTCPTYVAEETESAFCHPFISKSKIITEEKGCDCPKCPVYIEKGMKNGYYCTRKSEMEQEMAKKAM